MNQPGLTALEIDLVNRLRQMSLALKSSYARLTDKSGIWLGLEGLHDKDPHSSSVEALENREVMKPLYERLLEEWQRSADPENLARQDFLRIQRAMGRFDTVSAASHTAHVFAAVIGLLEVLLWV